jgi:hypothetical protein
MASNNYINNNTTNINNNTTNLRRQWSSGTHECYSQFMAANDRSDVEQERATNLLNQASGQQKQTIKNHVSSGDLDAGDAALASAGASIFAGALSGSSDGQEDILGLQVEKKKKKKKKKGGYADMMAEMMKPKQTDEEHRAQQTQHLAKNLGGGNFSKMDRI